jgi:hypothetical protein
VAIPGNVKRNTLNTKGAFTLGVKDLSVEALTPC